MFSFYNTTIITALAVIFLATITVNATGCVDPQYVPLDSAFHPGTLLPAGRTH